MFWDRQSRSERISALHEIQETLRLHHRTTPGPEAHPKDSFPVPEWSGAERFSRSGNPGRGSYMESLEPERSSAKDAAHQRGNNH